MRPLRYSINVTLDGCVDHTAVEPDDDLLRAVHRNAEQNIARAGALVFGRVTYEMMESAWRLPLQPEMPDWTLPFARAIDAAPKYVVSRTLDAVDWNAEIVRGDLETTVRALKEEPGDSLFTGGVMLPMALAEMGLIDEYEFVVHPRIVGGGRKLFAGLTQPLDLKLVEREELASGVVAMRYVPRGEP